MWTSAHVWDLAPILRSRPEQKARPAPVRITTRHSSFVATTSSYAWSSDTRLKLIAFSRSGRFSLKIVTVELTASSSTADIRPLFLSSHFQLT